MIANLLNYLTPKLNLSIKVIFITGPGSSQPGSIIRMP